MSSLVSRALIAAALLAICTTMLVGCGGSSGGGHAGAAAQRRDRDDDGDHNDDDAQTLEYGHAAVGSERRELVELIRDYYAAAAAGNGARACKLLVPFVAESVAETWGHTSGMRGDTCAQSLAKLFEHEHTLLQGESATLKFVALRIGDGRALDVLGFAVLPEVRQIRARQIDGHWRLLELRDTILE